MKIAPFPGISRLFAVCLLAALVTPASVSGQEAHDEPEAHGEEAPWSGFRVGSNRNWIFRSFMVDEGDDATVLGVELESYIGVGGYQVKNIAYLEVADYPRAVPGQPPGNPEPGTEADTGISDLLTGFWISKQGGHHGKHHFAPGIAFQLPTATSETLGSGKWSVGPSFDYEYESGSLFAGAIALQIWSFAGDDDRKDVSMLMIKPFVYYSLSDRWDLTYVPYGISVYWNKPSGEAVYLPIGGGGQYKTHLGSLGLNLGAQLFYNVVRPTTGTVWDLRFLAEVVF
ncbi:MAG: hypothetical protein M8865_02785 [marine benthic group bacterium]|nr:hypothetical protein [Gemmatimonadota bacterium]